MDRKLSILMVHNYYQISGGETTVIDNERKLLEENGHKVYLYSRDNTEIKTMNILKKLFLPVNSIFNLKTYFDVKRIIQEKKIDVVHVHNTIQILSPAVYYAAVSRKIPVVQTIHNFRLLCPAATFYRDGKICEDCVSRGLGCALKHRCYRNSFLQTLLCVINTRIHKLTGIYGKINYICLTEFNKEKLLKRKDIDAQKVFIKPNFVADAPRELPMVNRKDQMVFAGRLDKLKGIDDLLYTWRELNLPETKLVICGTGPMEEWCRQFARENKLNVQLLGYVSVDKVKDILKESRALILPTKWYEGFPMSIVESYSVGTPVICPDFGNCGSLVVNGVSGVTYQENGLGEAIRGCRDMYASTFELYNKKYNKENNLHILESIYSEIVG